MGFHGYGGSELDHSDCLIYPCSECRHRADRLQPSARSGNAYSDPTSNPNNQGSRASVFGNENIDSNTANRAAGAGTAADNAGDLSGGLRSLSLSDQDRTLRDEMRQSGFRIPSISEGQALHHPVDSQGRSKDTGFQSQNQPQPDDGRPRLSEEDRALRDEMRHSGFRIPSVSDDPALSHPQGGQHRSDCTGFQAQNPYQADNNAYREATGSLSPGSPIPTNRFGYYHCPGCLPHSGEPWCPTEMTWSTDDVAPWACDHPTTEKSLQRVLRNKMLASYDRSQESAENPQPSTLPETSSQGQTVRPDVPMDRLTRLDESEMELDETYDWDSATERRIPDRPEGQNESQNECGQNRRQG